jgi:putative flippase GtrA
MKGPRVRSLLVSLLTTAIEVTLFAVCTFLWFGSTTLVVARWLCGTLGAGCNFILNRAWAFRDDRSCVARQMGRYAVAALVAVSLATFLWWSLFRLTGWDPRLVHVLSMAMVWLGFTYPMLRGWVFRPTPSS